MLNRISAKKTIGFSGIVLIIILMASHYPGIRETEGSTTPSQTPDIEAPAVVADAVDLIDEEHPAEKEQSVITGKIGRKPVYVELVDRGIAPAEVINLANAFKPVFNFRKAAPGDTFTIVLNDDNRLSEFVYKKGLLTQYKASKNSNGGFHVFKKEVALDKETVAKEFVLESSLYHAITSQGEDSRLVNRLTDIFSWDIDFYLYPRKGDRIRILYERYSKDGTFVYYGKILAAHYHGTNGTNSAYLALNRGTTTYYDEKGHSLEKMFLKTPLKFGKKTSSYSNRRFHPVTKTYKRHTGNDYGAKTGTDIFATAGGKVIYSGWKGGYGKIVIIRHPNGYQTYYAHCSKLIAKKGDYVDQGQVIAKVGATGRVTGPHVHYEVRINGKPVNPNTVKSNPGKPIKQEMLEYYFADVCKMVSTMYSMISENNKKVPESSPAYVNMTPETRDTKG